MTARCASGQLGRARIASFPDLPTFRELGYKDSSLHLGGLFAQSALPGRS